MKNLFTSITLSLLVLTSCSNDPFLEDYDSSEQLSYGTYVSVDLSEPYKKDAFKENYMFMEALRRIDQNILIENGKASLSHVTAEELNINKEFFIFISSILDQMDSDMVKKYLIQTRMPKTRSGDYYDPEFLRTAYEMIGIALAAAYVFSQTEDCDLIYTLFADWINGYGDYGLSDGEWSDIKSYINSNKPSIWGNQEYSSQMGGYYYHRGTTLNNTKYHLALGDVNCFWNSNKSCIGIYEKYDMNPSDRSDFAEFCVRYANLYGGIIGAKDFYVKKGLYTTSN